MQTKEYRCYKCGLERRHYPNYEGNYAEREEGFCAGCNKSTIFLGVNDGYGWDERERRFLKLPKDLKEMSDEKDNRRA